jgi:hypothetical protein
MSTQSIHQKANPGRERHDTRKNGDVVIHHHDRVATILRGTRAAAFLDDIDSDIRSCRRTVRRSS